MTRKFIHLHVFDDNIPYIDRAAVSALIQEQFAPTIIQGAVENSTVLKMAYRLPDMTTHQTRLPILDSLPMAYFLDADEGQKQTTTMKWKNKYINAEELAVIVPFSQSAADDTDYDLVEQATPRLSEAAGRAIDAAVIFGTGKPTTWPDGIVTQATAAGAVVEASTNLYDDLLGVGGTISKVEESGYFVNGHIAAIGMRAALRGLKDNDGRPLFLNSMQAPGNYTLDGSAITFPRNGAFDTSKAQIISGDFSQLMYSIRQDIKIEVFTEGVVQNPDGSIAYNLMQNDMFAIRMTMRLGWVLPNPINGLNDTETRFPFAFLAPKSAKPGDDDDGGDDEPNVQSAGHAYTESELNAMTIDQIKATAAGMGYTINATTKAAIINEFLNQQNAAG